METSKTLQAKESELLRYLQEYKIIYGKIWWHELWEAIAWVITTKMDSTSGINGEKLHLGSKYERIMRNLYHTHKELFHDKDTKECEEEYKKWNNLDNAIQTTIA